MEHEAKQQITISYFLPDSPKAFQRNPSYFPDPGTNMMHTIMALAPSIISKDQKFCRNRLLFRSGPTNSRTAPPKLSSEKWRAVILLWSVGFISMKNITSMQTLQSGRLPKYSSSSVLISPWYSRKPFVERCQMTDLRCRRILPALTLVSGQVPCLKCLGKTEYGTLTEYGEKRQQNFHAVTLPSILRDAGQAAA